MKWSELVNEAKKAGGFFSAIQLADKAADFAEENDISPVMQNEIEAAIREGAVKADQDPDLRVEYFFAGPSGDEV